MGACGSKKELVNEEGLHASYKQGKLPSNLLRQQVNQDPMEKYEKIKVLGVGSMGSVCLARLKRTNYEDSDNSVYAIKTIRKGRLSSNFVRELRNEINIIRRLDHPNIIKFYDVYYSNNISIVMEFCDGGDLYARSPYTEKQAFNVLHQLLKAVRYMHREGFVHRDIKFENVMFVSKDPASTIRVIDFGLSGRYNPKSGDRPLSAQLGTIDTMAPEVLSGNYTNVADLWSVGVVAFELLAGVKPFVAATPMGTLSKITRGDYYMNSMHWKNISPSAKDFVRKLLDKNTSTRLDAKKALNHAWILKNEQKSLGAASQEEESSSVIDDIVLHGKSPRMKKLALLLVAHNTVNDKVEKLHTWFDQMDTGKTGVISLSEFKAAMRNVGMSDTEVEELFSSMDVYQDCRVAYTEFLATLLEAHVNITEENLADAFDRLDVSNTGHISLDDLREIVGTSLPDEQIKSMFTEADVNQNGKVSYEEFLALFRKQESLVGRKANLFA